MSNFRVKPTALQNQGCEMQQAYCHMCAAVEELSAVIRALQTMSYYDEVIQNLLRISRKGEEQYTQIRQCAKTLDRAAELYARTERDNQVDRVTIRRTVRTGTSRLLPGPTAISLDWQVVLQPVEMLSFAQKLFGTEVLVPLADD